MKAKSEKRAKKKRKKDEVCFFFAQCDAIALSFYAVDKIDLELNEDIYSYILVISLCSFCFLIIYVIFMVPRRYFNCLIFEIRGLFFFFFLFFLNVSLHHRNHHHHRCLSRSISFSNVSYHLNCFNCTITTVITTTTIVCRDRFFC